MKRTYLYLTLLFLFVFSACNFTEELNVNEDGTGKMSINFDGSQLMQMAGDKITEEGEKKIDSTISFKQLFEEKKDSIATLPQEEQDKLKRLENFTMHMLMDSETQEMNFSMYSDFDTVEELGDMLSSFQDASALQNKKGASGPPMATTSNGTEIKYSFKNNLFTRTTKIVDNELFKQGLDSLEQAKMFLGGSVYKLKYNFPRRIKKISAEDALFSQDGKSFTLEVDFLAMMEDPTILNLEVELED